MAYISYCNSNINYSYGNMRRWKEHRSAESRRRDTALKSARSVVRKGSASLLVTELGPGWLDRRRGFYTILIIICETDCLSVSTGVRDQMALRQRMTASCDLETDTRDSLLCGSRFGGQV